MGMWCSLNHLRTPTWASPSAPPPSRATPILGRVVGAGFASARVAEDCGGGAGGFLAKERHVRKSGENKGRGRRPVGSPSSVCWAGENLLLLIVTFFCYLGSHFTG